MNRPAETWSPASPKCVVGCSIMALALMGGFWAILMCVDVLQDAAQPVAMFPIQGAFGD